MSEWTENENRMDVPYSTKRKFVCVEHPGKVENEDKGLNTLGGNEAVSKTYSNPVKRLAVSWRPEDIYSKPVYGDRIAVTNLLVKVKKRKRKSDGKVEYSVQIMGPVEVSYKFQGMCDFQYLPVKVLPEGTFEDISGQIQISTLNDRQEYLNKDMPLYVPPVAFSRVDRPCDFLYRQSIEHRGTYNNPDLARPPNLIGTVRQRRTLHTIFVNYGEALPKEPIPEAVKRLSANFVDPNGEKVIKKLLEEKPLWLKVELEHRTGYRGEKLKTFLPALCFYWLDGPWRAQWNKFGYDPTKDKAAKIYQTIDFRIRQAKPGQMKVRAKRTDFRVNQWNTTNRNQKQNVKIDIGSLGEGGSKPKSQKPAAAVDKELYYKFKPDKVPPHRMMYYPVYYVEVDEVQQLAHQNDGKETVCSEKDGWCVKDFNERAREHMYRYLNRLLQRSDSVEMRFWRSKKVKRKNELLQLDGDENDSSGPVPITSQTDESNQQDTDLTAAGDISELPDDYSEPAGDSNQQAGRTVDSSADMDSAGNQKMDGASMEPSVDSTSEMNSISPDSDSKGLTESVSSTDGDNKVEDAKDGGSSQEGDAGATSAMNEAS